MPGLSRILLHDRWFKWVVVFIIFFLLGTRGLNEPDEGRYAEIGREMLETGNWLVPNIWYVPHLDKPPMTYWLVGLSIGAFGLNEWAIRLPIALAGLSGVWAVYLLGLSMGGRRVAQWSVLILSSSLLYFVIARMVMTDMILLQFMCWGIYFFWRSWRCLDRSAGFQSAQTDCHPMIDCEKPVAGSGESVSESSGGFAESDAGCRRDACATGGDEDFSPAQLQSGSSAKRSFFWQLAAWVMFAGGFLTKGPLVFLIPAFALVGLFIYARRERTKLSVMLFGVLAGLPLFCLLALPWFVLLWQAIPEAYDYMVKGQVVGHALEAGKKNRGGPIIYFIPILIAGFLPWTVLLGWVWRKSHWQSLTRVQKEGWVLLTCWAGLTFLFFSINSAKLPHYIVPMMPALAILVAWRWPDWGERADASVPRWACRVVVISPFIALVGISLAYRFAFRISDQPWIWWQTGIAGILGIVLWCKSSNWSSLRCAETGFLSAVFSLFVLVGLMPLVDSQFRSNQTLRELGALVKREFKTGDALVIHQRIPQGLPLYIWPIINQHQRPYFMQLPEHRMPYAFPGNQEKLAPFTLPDADALTELMNQRRVICVGWRGSLASLQAQMTNAPLRMIAESGHWELFSSR